MKRPSSLCLSVATLLLCAGCSNQLTTNASKQADVRMSESAGDTRPQTRREAVALADARNQEVSAFNAEVENAVANESLTAWRKAIAGDKQGALKMLEDLDRRYPNVNTVKFMRGQVYEHFGDKKEALKYFQMAVQGNEFSSLKLFKLAEIKRTTGDAKGAIEDYRKLLEHGEFLPAEVGMAECLYTLDKNSKESRKIIENVLSAEPKNKEALALQSKFKTK